MYDLKNMKTVNQFILVQVIEKEEKTESGIFIPIESQEKSQFAKVINQGSSDQVSDGDIIYFKKYAGIESEGNLLILKQEEVIGIVEYYA